MRKAKSDAPKRVVIADLPRTRSERFISVYANHTEATPGFYELALVFCRIGKNRGMELAVEEEAEVIMSWEHVAGVRDLLNRMVDSYQTQHGKIRFVSAEDDGPVSSGTVGRSISAPVVPASEK